MDRKTTKPMTPLDCLVTPPHLYTMKLMLPYTPASNQYILAVYIKFLELRYTMDAYRHFPMHSGSGTRGSPSPFGMFEDLKPYMDPEERARMEQMAGMMDMMELMKQFQNAQGDGSPGFNPMDMMQGMFTPEQQEMFNMYSNMFDSDLGDAYSGNEGRNSEDRSNDNRKEGSRNHERMDESSSDEEY